MTSTEQFKKVFCCFTNLPAEIQKAIDTTQSGFTNTNSFFDDMLIVSSETPMFSQELLKRIGR